MSSPKMNQDELMIYRKWDFDPLIDGEELAQSIAERINNEAREQKRIQMEQAREAEKNADVEETANDPVGS